MTRTPPVTDVVATLTRWQLDDLASLYDAYTFTPELIDVINDISAGRESVRFCFRETVSESSSESSGVGHYSSRGTLFLPVSSVGLSL